MPCSSGSRRTPCRINSQSAKLICRAAALDTRSALSCACGLALLTLQGLDVTWPGFKQQLLQCTTLVQAALDFRHQVLRDVNGKTPPLCSTVQDPTRVLFARLTGLTVRADARGAAQAERAENCGESLGRLSLEPAPDISG